MMLRSFTVTGVTALAFFLTASSAVAALAPWSVTFTRRAETERKVDWRSVAAATKELDAARAELHRIAAGARRQIEQSPEFASAARDLRMAQTRYDTAVVAATFAVERSAAYLSTDVELHRCQQAIRDTRRDDTKKLHQLAQQAMTLRQRLNDLRRDALEQSPEVAAARFEVLDANARLSLLRDQAGGAATTDPAWRSAKARYTAARARYAASAGG